MLIATYTNENYSSWTPGTLILRFWMPNLRITDLAIMPPLDASPADSKFVDVVVFHVDDRLLTADSWAVARQFENYFVKTSD